MCTNEPASALCIVRLYVGYRVSGFYVIDIDRLLTKPEPVRSNDLPQWVSQLADRACAPSTCGATILKCISVSLTVPAAQQEKRVSLSIRVGNVTIYYKIICGRTFQPSNNIMYKLLYCILNNIIKLKNIKLLKCYGKN